MSHAPATPSKSRAEAGVLTVFSTEKSALASGNMRSSLNEPSPASTYGETTAGDSIPATPQDTGDQGTYLTFLGFMLPLLHACSSTVLLFDLLSVYFVSWLSCAFCLQVFSILQWTVPLLPHLCVCAMTVACSDFGKINPRPWSTPCALSH